MFNKFKATSPRFINNQKIQTSILLLCIIGFSSYCIPLTISGQAFAQAQFSPNQNNGGFSNQQQSPGFSPQQPQQSPSSGSGYQTYQSPNLGFSIQYPAGSQVTEKQDGVQIRFLGGSMFILVQGVGNMMLNEYSQLNINKLGLTGQNILQGDSTLAGYPAHHITYTDSNGIITTMSWTIVGNTGYIVAYLFPTGAPRSLLDVLRTGLQSFQVSTSQQQPGFGQQQPGFGQQQPQQQPGFGQQQPQQQPGFGQQQPQQQQPSQ